MILGLAAMLVAFLLVGGALAGGAALFHRTAARLGAPAPLLTPAALACGLAAAAALLLAAPDRTAFAPGRLFDATSPWQAATPDAVLALALPEAAALRGALAALAGAGSPAQAAAAWLAAACFALGLAAAWRSPPGRPRRLALAAFAAMAAATALSVHYATQLLAWGLAQIGFWLLLLALLALQVWRRRRAAAH